MVKMVVEHCGTEVVGRGDCVQVTGEMEVDMFHRKDLRVAAASSATLDSEDRSHGRFSDDAGGRFSEPIQSLIEADGCDGLSFAERCWIDTRDQNE